ncbi:MAG: phosphatase PAP2 family protein [Patescibacteria group bacterium]
MLNAIISADIWFENALLSVRTPFLLHLFNWVTLLGDTIFIVSITGIVIIFLLFYKYNKAYAIGLVATVVGARGTSYIMKILIERARPDGLIPAITETSSSFPSGHATLAMALYGFLTYLFCKRYPKNSVIITAIAMLAIIAIGFSRLYLGVHFPSDVLAGYLLGGIWLLIGIKITKLIR